MDPARPARVSSCPPFCRETVERVHATDVALGGALLHVNFRGFTVSIQALLCHAVPCCAMLCHAYHLQLVSRSLRVPLAESAVPVRFLVAWLSR